MPSPTFIAADEIEAITASIHLTPIATCITDNRKADNPIIAANHGFCLLSGYDLTEIIGRNCRFLAGLETEPEARAHLRQAIANEEPTIVELTNYRKDGTAFRNAVMIAPIFDQPGSAGWFYGSQMEIDGPTSATGLRRDKARTLVGALTKRQRQVLALVSSGYRNKQIGFELGIDEKTVKMHRAHMLKSLGVQTTADAIRIAVEAGVPLPVD